MSQGSVTAAWAAPCTATSAVIASAAEAPAARAVRRQRREDQGAMVCLSCAGEAARARRGAQVLALTSLWVREWSGLAVSVNRDLHGCFRFVNPLRGTGGRRVGERPSDGTPARVEAGEVSRERRSRHRRRSGRRRLKGAGNPAARPPARGAGPRRRGRVPRGSGSGSGAAAAAAAVNRNPVRGAWADPAWVLAPCGTDDRSGVSCAGFAEGHRRSPRLTMPWAMP